jgi:micrococcal nuclease
MIIALLVSGCSPTPVEESATLVQVIDGDTVRLRVSGSIDDVRLVGLNTPERDECHSAEATEALRSLVSAGDLRLEPAGPHDRDRFDRLLRYLYAGETLLNLAMIEKGHGLAVAGDHPRSGEFAAAVDTAWARRRGMWGPSACGDAVSTTIEIFALEADPPGDDNERVNEEFVVLRNTGTAAADLSGWRLRDESSTHRFQFADGSLLEAGARLTIHSGCGPDSVTDLYWCAGPVWSNGGDTAILQTPSGNVVDRLSYSRG